MMKMRVVACLVLALAFANSASASWYAKMYESSKSWLWPFGGTNDVNSAKEPRLSELMEPASLAIDDAADLLADGNTDKAVEKYREALRLLERLEIENPERAVTPEFQSVRNKRAYVDAQLNAILLDEARLNAKAVAVTDTTDLEEKLRKKRAGEAAEKREEKEAGVAVDTKPKLERQLDAYMEDARARDKKLNRAAVAAKFERETDEQIQALLKKNPESRKARVLRAGLELYRKNYGNARKDLDILLSRDPDDVSALNMLAAVEVACGNNSAAEAALAKAIRADEKDYHAYYNLAKLLCRQGNGRDADRAKSFYKHGRQVGGPEDPSLERILK